MDGILLPAILLLVGALAFFLEAFVPSGGLITVAGIGCTCAALGLAFYDGGATVGLVFLIITIIIVPASLVSAFVLLPRTALGQRVFLMRSQKTEDGYTAQSAEQQKLLGQTGEALSVLRPSGEARIDGQRYDVMTGGEMIEKGAAIEVRRVEGNRIVVRQVREGDTEA
jgi:membrane-bound serine protease (ClpP class)